MERSLPQVLRMSRAEVTAGEAMRAIAADARAGYLADSGSRLLASFAGRASR